MQILKVFAISRNLDADLILPWLRGIHRDEICFWWWFFLRNEQLVEFIIVTSNMPSRCSYSTSEKQWFTQPRLYSCVMPFVCGNMFSFLLIVGCNYGFKYRNLITACLKTLPAWISDVLFSILSFCWELWLWGLNEREAIAIQLEGRWYLGIYTRLML